MDKAKLSKIAAGTEVRPPDVTGDAATREARAKLQEVWDDKNRALHTMHGCGTPGGLGPPARRSWRSQW